MTATSAGGKLAAIKNKAKYGDDYYARIGRKGGLNGNTGGFFKNRELARQAGAVGGRKSRRGRNSTEQEKEARRQRRMESTNA